MSPGGTARRPADIFGSLRDVDLNPDLLNLVSELIAERKQPWSPDRVRDPVQERLLDLINEKKKGGPPRRAKDAAEPASSNVVNIVDALRRCVAAEAKRPPARPRR
jgi:DNA end-binding protein Ku